MWCKQCKGRSSLFITRMFNVVYWYLPKKFPKSVFSIIIKSFQVLISGKGRFLRYVVVPRPKTQKH